MVPDPSNTLVEQEIFVVPDFPIKDLLAVIPSHCRQRSALRSLSYLFMDIAVITILCKGAMVADAELLSSARDFALPHLVPFIRFAVWALYGFGAGLFGTGLWAIGHECGHQAFSESKLLNNTVGWILHSALGVPYYSFKITHAKHHAFTNHVTQDQGLVPPTRSEVGLPPLDPVQEDPLGSNVTQEVKKELWEALGDSPLGATLRLAGYLLAGFPAYLMFNTSGQRRYPKGTNHFSPSCVFFSPNQYTQVLLSDLGIFLWLASIMAGIYYQGFSNVFKFYLVPFFWVNHWVVLITFLQHTDPILPHYRGSEFTFARGALATLDRSMMGNLGSAMGWLGAVATHGICETHILHHVASRIPHYHAWEASQALKAKLTEAGMQCQGNPVSWAEMYRVFKECKFVEDEGDVVFYKNAYGLAKMRAIYKGLAN